MTWPTVVIDTTDCDSDTDDPRQARLDILDAIQKLNQIIGHVSPFAATVLDDTDAAAIRTTIGAMATDAEITAIAGLESDADKGIYFTGPGAAALFTLTPAARTVLDDTTVGAMLATLGGQPLDAELTAIAALTSAADQAILYTGSGTATLFTITSAARTVLDDTSVASMLTTLGGQPLDAELTAIAGLTSAADQAILYTGSGTATLFTITAAARTVLDDTSVSVMLATLGGQPLDATLTALAAFNTNGLLVQTAADTFAGRTLTAPAAGFTITNPAGTAGNPTFVLANDLAALEGLSTNGLVTRTGTDAMTTRAITGSTSITVTNGDGVSGAPTLALSTTHLPGKTAIFIPASSMTPRSANGCAALATSNGAANQPDVHYLAFDAAADEFAGFQWQMPKSWNEGTITVRFQWRRASGTGAANVVWGVRALAVSDNDTPAAAFGTAATVTDDAKTTLANFSLSGETGACTIAGTPAAEDLVFFEVFRDADNASDTLDAVDAWLSGVTIFITTDAFNDA